MRWRKIYAKKIFVRKRQPRYSEKQVIIILIPFFIINKPVVGARYYRAPTHLFEAVAPDRVTIVAGEASGRVHFLRLENSSGFGSECNG